MKGNYTISQADDLELSYAFDQYDKSDYLVPTSRDVRDYSNVQHTLRTLYNHTFVGKHILSVGGDYMRDYLMSYQFTDNGSHTQHTADAFAQFDWNPHRRFNLIAGLRFDYFSEARLSHFSPKIGVMYKVANCSLRASYAGGFRAPTLKEMYMDFYMGNIFMIYGNPNLKPEESKQWEAGLEGLTGPVDWRLSAYRYEIQNLIDYDNNAYYNVKSATIKGLEWTGNITTGPVEHHLTLQYVDPRDDETNKILYRRAKQQVKYELNGQVYDLGWDVTYHYIGKRYDYDYDNSRTVNMGGLSLWDVGLSYPVTSHLTVRGKIANLFDKDYETVYGYQSAGREYTLSGSYTF